MTTKKLLPGERGKKQSDFMRVQHGAMSQSEYNAKWKISKKPKSTSFRATLKRTLGEEAPANAVGGGHVAGLGIGPQGEPAGISKMKALWRRYLKGVKK